MSNINSNERFRRPSIAFAEGLKKAAGGVYVERGEYVPFMFRAVVIAADPEGGKLETPDGKADGGNRTEEVADENGNIVASYEIIPTRGPRNPKNSIRARIISGNKDKFIDDDNLRTFWPMFPGSNNPSPGEVYYVVFEDSEMVHGLWLTKAPSNDPDESKNQLLLSTILKSNYAATQKTMTLGVAGLPPTGSTPPNASPITKSNRLSSLFIDYGG